MARKASPKALQEKDPNANTATTTPAPNDKSSPKQQKTKKNDVSEPTTAASLSTIHLEGEEDESVPIYATADDIRKLINSHLPSTSKAAFARDLTELLPNSKVTTRNMDQLLKMKGPLAGAHNIAFYAGYVFFEKIRVRDGKKKSAKRQKLEEIYTGKQDGNHGHQPGKPGVPREGSHTMVDDNDIHAIEASRALADDNSPSQPIVERPVASSVLPVDGIPVASSKPDSAPQAQAPSSQAPESSSQAQRSSSQAKESSALASIHLDGEETESAPIYETCADIRRQITKHLKDCKSNKAAFARELSALLPTSKVDAKTLTRFMSASGPLGAGHNPAFYAAWLFFEKSRIKQGKKKSERQQKMEKIWGPNGVKRVNGNTKKLILKQGQNWKMDGYGRGQILEKKNGMWEIKHTEKPKGGEDVD